jgi:hypothetical protein
MPTICKCAIWITGTVLSIVVDHLVNNASIWQVCKFEEVEDVNKFRTLMVYNYYKFSVLHTNLGQTSVSHFAAVY